MEETSLTDFAAVLRRRRRLMAGTAVVALAVCLGVTFSLPPVYFSAATILIEQPTVPENVVRPALISHADQGVQLIKQRVMTRENLLQLIEAYDLYADQASDESVEGQLERIRKDVKLEMVRAEVIDPRSGKPSRMTIGFRVGFESKQPSLAKAVAEELTARYLEENKGARRQSAADTAEFLATEARKLELEVSSLESALAEFKERHMDQLPELVQRNLQLMDRLEREILEVERQLRVEEEKRIYLRSQLAQLSPQIENPVKRNRWDDQLLTPKERLKLLETQYLTLSARYAAGHPDLLRVSREIAALRRQVGVPASTAELLEELETTRAELAAKREGYSEEHPDVKRLSRRVDVLENELAASRSQATPVADSADNPAYIEVRARLQATDAELRALRIKNQELKAKLVEYEERLSRSPEVERQYRNLIREYDNALQKYKEYKAKQLEARIAESLETESKSERFTLFEAATLPLEAIRPNRTALSFISFVLSIAGAVAAAALAELTDQTIRGTNGVARLTGEPALAGIPRIRRTYGRLTRGRMLAVGFVVASFVVVAAVAVNDKLVARLESLWMAMADHLVK